jgi:hypothetical protein
MKLFIIENSRREEISLINNNINELLSCCEEVIRGNEKYIYIEKDDKLNKVYIVEGNNEDLFNLNKEVLNYSKSFI